MTKSDISDSWKGQTCPFCEKGILYYVEKRTLGCSECEETLNLDQEWLSRKKPDIVVPVWDNGEFREFWADSKVTPEELLQHLIQAYVLIESCAISQPDNEIIHTLMHLTKHSLERLGVEEAEPGQVTKKHKTGLVKGILNWVDKAIFEGAEPW